MNKTGEQKGVDNEFVLYRKYRPQDFSAVIGQDHVVSVLKNSIKLGRVAHAYLFAGSRGTGKTSVARIFARELGTIDADLYEIDAASNRGIDDIRELREGVRTLPFESKYKVYIIDEAHMLTKDAANALLKTLEEPPAHALFILATTEPEKLPETVLSRCQVFTFKKPHQAVLREFISGVAKKEGFTLAPDAADLVAILGDGSFRDAQGILQKVITASADKKISLKEVEMVTGAPRGELVMTCLEAIAEGGPAGLEKALSAVRAAADQNIDMDIFAKLLLERVRFVLLLRISNSSAQGIGAKAAAGSAEAMIQARLSPDVFEKLKNLAGAGDSDKRINSAALLKLIDAFELTGRAFIPELPLELTFIEIIGE